MYSSYVKKTKNLNNNTVRRNRDMVQAQNMLDILAGNMPMLSVLQVGLILECDEM